MSVKAMRSFGILRQLLRASAVYSHSLSLSRQTLLMPESCLKVVNQSRSTKPTSDILATNRPMYYGVPAGTVTFRRIMTGLNTSSAAESPNMVMTGLRTYLNNSVKRFKGFASVDMLSIRSAVKGVQMSSATKIFRPLRHCRTTLILRIIWSAGLLSAAKAVNAEQNNYLAPCAIRDLRTNNGPRTIGIGWIPSSVHSLLAGLLFLLSFCSTAFVIVSYPYTLPWILAAASLAFSTRPDVDSFLAWTRREAPRVAAQKALLIDKLRAISTPFVITWIRRPDLVDYGLFSVVTLTDHADYVYVYAGVFSRWFLLGWYNLLDEYNFDDASAVPKGTRHKI